MSTTRPTTNNHRHYPLTLDQVLDIHDRKFENDEHGYKVEWLTSGLKRHKTKHDKESHPKKIIKNLQRDKLHREHDATLEEIQETKMSYGPQFENCAFFIDEDSPNKRVLLTANNEVKAALLQKGFTELPALAIGSVLDVPKKSNATNVTSTSASELTTIADNAPIQELVITIEKGMPPCPRKPNYYKPFGKFITDQFEKELVYDDGTVAAPLRLWTAEKRSGGDKNNLGAFQSRMHLCHCSKEIKNLKDGTEIKKLPPSNMMVKEARSHADLAKNSSSNSGGSDWWCNRCMEMCNQQENNSDSCSDGDQSSSENENDLTLVTQQEEA